ncbi:hypothetical protein [Micromonospora sp. WP24]|nr:hypothetical protein [Micromonospora sp. WP24]
MSSGSCGIGRSRGEATEWLVLTEPVELAFDTHTRVLADFLAAHRAG